MKNLKSSEISGGVTKGGTPDLGLRTDAHLFRDVNPFLGLPFTPFPRRGDRCDITIQYLLSSQCTN